VARESSQSRELATFPMEVAQGSRVQYKGTYSRRSPPPRRLAIIATPARTRRQSLAKPAIPPSRPQWPPSAWRNSQ